MPAWMLRAPAPSTVGDPGYRTVKGILAAGTEHGDDPPPPPRPGTAGDAARPRRLRHRPHRLIDLHTEPRSPATTSN